MPIETHCWSGFTAVPDAPTVLWPDNLQVDVTRTAPQGRLVIKEPQHGFGKPLLLADVTFDYAGTQFAFSDGQQGHFDAAKNRAICRNRSQERQLLDRLQALGIGHGMRRPAIRRMSNFTRGTLLGLSTRSRRNIGSSRPKDDESDSRASFN